jgi:hypothetical protein
MRASLLLLLLVPALSGCHQADQTKADDSTFEKRMECANLAATGKWEDLPEGPYLDNTYYSPASDTCIFVMKQSFRAEKDGNIRAAYSIIDGLTRRQLWTNDPQAGDTEDQLSAKLNDQLKKLQITP